MTADIVVWPGKANITIPVTTMPTVFDLEQAGRATHVAFTITIAELRTLAAQTARAVEQFDQHLAETGGLQTGGTPPMRGTARPAQAPEPHTNRLEHP